MKLLFTKKLQFFVILKILRIIKFDKFINLKFITNLYFIKIN